MMDRGCSSDTGEPRHENVLNLAGIAEFSVLMHRWIFLSTDLLTSSLIPANLVAR